eukprot:6589988-Prymnesium_polylepis.1
MILLSVVLLLDRSKTVNEGSHMPRSHHSCSAVGLPLLVRERRRGSPNTRSSRHWNTTLKYTSISRSSCSGSRYLYHQYCHGERAG